MPARANAFYGRLVKVNPKEGHVYNTTTKARMTQAKFFLDALTGEVELNAPAYLDEFDKRDMLLFGLVNSLRSALDSFTHELVIFYGGSAKNRRNVHFSNLLKPIITISLPRSLRDWIQQFQGGNTFGYLNKLRNAQQHRCYPLMQTRTVSRASVTIIGSDSTGGPANWWGGEALRQVYSDLVPTSTCPEPDLRLPDDPDVKPGDETYKDGRPVFAVMRYLYGETREFILISYALAT